MSMYSKTCNKMIWVDMALCGLHDHIIRAKHCLFGQGKPGFPHFADGTIGNLDTSASIEL